MLGRLGLLMINQTSTIKILILSLMLLVLPSCATVEPGQEPNPDPWEAWNRPVSSFNYALDRAILRPLAIGYRTVMPQFGEDAVSRIFGNVGEVNSLVNNLLQGQPKQAGNSTGRFLVNSTLGVGGIFDVASLLGLEKQDPEDFGQTLGVWGVGPGPYFVIPFMGPSTLRDAPSLAVDALLDPVNYIDEDVIRIPINGVDLIETRASLLENERLITGDIYIFIRDVYLQRREFLIKDGELEDDSDDFLDDF